MLVYLYDAEGSPIGMLYRTTSYAEGDFEVYWFEKNLQGDVVAIYNANGTKLAVYKYDAWGRTTVTYYNGGSSTNATLNPFRYRGYYYDTETGFYYLQSRYYDPATGRFISSDGQLNGALLGYNQFAYCHNSPIVNIDPDGRFFVNAVVTIMIIVAIEHAMPSEEEHYARNQYNLRPNDDEAQLIASRQHPAWEKADDSANKYHVFTNGTQGEEAKDNVKFMSKDGHHEVIICVPNGDESKAYIVDDPNNEGTYNFGTNLISHAILDVFPYLRWGNSEDDTTTRKERGHVIFPW